MDGRSIALLPVARREFFARNTVAVARDLLGCLLIRRTRQGVTAGRIVETEAYLAEGDSASHSRRGKTPGNASMFGEPGLSYVYTIHARFCFNLVTESRNVGTAVLVRALAPICGMQLMAARRNTSQSRLWTRGPARLCEAMSIDRRFNGWNATRGRRLWVAEDVDWKRPDILVSPRIGVTSAQDLPLRFYVADPNVSR